ncbi:uncharacterized protein LOC117187097 [Drosophila miranda]|uniref:uncharacterized protein LOC117187097 n=1 Tax=Drosophila miranda TaxID=7229 RepID=UPI00143FAC38|nr:uncharacterized protein LOC117187097 [Drosophila miranda]
MKFYLGLVAVLCFCATKSMADNGKQISSANMSSYTFIKKLTDVTKMKCYLYWMSRLVKNSGNIVSELTKCVKQFGDKAMRVVAAFKELVAVIRRIFEACTGIIVDKVVGGAACLKAFTLNSFSLFRALKKFHDEVNSEPQSKTACAKKALKEYFEASSVYEVIDSCIYPGNTTNTKADVTSKPTDRPFYKKILPFI